MQLLDMSFKKKAILSANEYINLFEKSPNSIDFVKINLPQLGKDR